MHTNDAELTLAERLLIFMGKMAEREDVMITLHHTWSGPVKSWASALPEDMLAFYEQCNGVKFFYEMKESKVTGGIFLLGLDRNGKGVIEPAERRGRIVSPRAPASKYGEYFLDESSSIAPDDKVLFWYGSMSGWGLLMVGETGDDVSFHTWDNDGFTSSMSVQSFSEIIERGLERAFVHTWHYDEHPLLEESLAEVQIEDPPLRETTKLRVLGVERGDASDWRAFLLGRFSPGGSEEKALLALLDLPKTSSLEERVEAFETYCSQESRAIKAADVKALAKACTYKSGKKNFMEHFKVGQDFEWEKIDMEVELYKGQPSLDTAFFYRLFASIEELEQLVDSFEGHRDVLRYTRMDCVARYRPFLSYSPIEKGRDSKHFTTSWVKAGHSDIEPAEYTSTVVLSAESLDR